MLILLSPSKTMNFKDPYYHNFRSPAHAIMSSILASRIKKYSLKQLSQLYQTSPTLTQDIYTVWSSFDTPDNPRSIAVFAYRGETYLGLGVQTMSKEDLEYADAHLVILSGLYGYLKPLDIIQPYRLELNNPFVPPFKSKTLKKLWSNIVTGYLKTDLEVEPIHASILINLASSEYSSIIVRSIAKQWIDVVFYEKVGAELITKTVFTKRARGLMARYIVQNRIESAEGLRDFDTSGYKYDIKLSTFGKFVFVRKPQTKG